MAIDASLIPDAIHWYEGMLLLPEHFRAAARRQELLSGYLAQVAAPYGWGVRRLEHEVVGSIWTGIPLGAILGTAMAGAGELRARLAARVVGQDAAVDTIVRRVITFQADLGDPTKPTGVFLLCGPSGVGKTETAMALADDGARGIDQVLSHLVLPELSARLLDRPAAPGVGQDARLCTTLAGDLAVTVSG